MLAAALEAVNQSLEAIIIILLVGCLIGSFTASGTIPAVVYYGLKLLSPAIFLPFVITLCAIVGVALGSAWTVSATLGIAFMAIGTTIGLNPALIAGAILSGATCGDKFSPLSDSTNLAAGSAQTGLRRVSCPAHQTCSTCVTRRAERSSHDHATVAPLPSTTNCT